MKEYEVYDTTCTGAIPMAFSKREKAEKYAKEQNDRTDRLGYGTPFAVREVPE